MGVADVVNARRQRSLRNSLDLPVIDRKTHQLVKPRVPFCKLEDPATYKPHTFDFIPNRNVEGLPSLEDWVNVFRNSRPQFHKMAMEDEEAFPDVEERKAAADRFYHNYEAVLQDIEKNPTKPLPGFEPETVNCISLSAMRDRCLREQGFTDCFKAVKGSETAVATMLLPQLLSELDAIPSKRERMEKCIRGVIAGNIFDLGAKHGADLFNSGKMPSFQETRDKLAPRPWAVDCLDAALDHITGEGKGFKKAILFTDNAGPDIMLGMTPFARELVKNGTSVVIAANEVPSINDCTAAELRIWLKNAAKHDKVLARALEEGTLSVAASGNSNCVIDLRAVSPKICDIAEDADLVVLEGMGRGIETNLHAKFSCASMKLGMIKHREVAMELKSDMFGCVCQFDSAPKKVAQIAEVAQVIRAEQ